MNVKQQREARQEQPASEQQQQEQPDQQMGFDGRPKRNPYCSRCRNHGKSAQVKGHKRHCEYRDCQCEGCKLVECRQIVSAAQIKRRRYQKQDEECGRRIEVSPPVLTREPNSDPAAIIAKTLIGSKQNKQLAQAASLAVPTTNLPLNVDHPNYPALMGLPPLPHPATAASSSSASTLPSSLSTLATMNSHPAANGKSNPIAPHRPHLHPLLPANQLAQHQQHPAGIGPPPSNGVLRLADLAGEQKQAAGPNLSNFAAAGLDYGALHRFPNSFFSALTSHHHHQQAAAAAAAAAALQHSAGGLPAPSSSAATYAPQSLAATTTTTAAAAAAAAAYNTNPVHLPNVREQFRLVEEVHQAFGPLAIYAWLRAEQFNLPKVRQAIELAKISFDELRQINGHSPLDLTSPMVVREPSAAAALDSAASLQAPNRHTYKLFQSNTEQHHLMVTIDRFQKPVL